MRRAAIVGMLPCLLVLAGVADAQEGRDHTHHPERGSTDPRVVLRMVATLQASYNAERGRYAATPQELRIPGIDALRLQMVASGSEGYTAVVTSATEECALFHGNVRPPREYLTTPDRMVCRALAGAGSRQGAPRSP